MVFGKEVGAGGVRVYKRGERMPYIGSVNMMFAEPGFLEREKAEKLIDQTANDFDPVLAPGPDLRSDQIEDGDVEAFEMTREAEMKIGAIGEERSDRLMALGETHELAVLAIDAWKMADYFRQADDSEARRLDHWFDSGDL